MIQVFPVRYDWLVPGYFLYITWMVWCDSSTSHTWNSANQTQCMPLLAVSSQVCVVCWQIRLDPFFSDIDSGYSCCLCTLVFVLVLEMIKVPSYPTLMSLVSAALQPSNVVLWANAFFLLFVWAFWEHWRLYFWHTCSHVWGVRNISQWFNPQNTARISIFTLSNVFVDI